MDEPPTSDARTPQPPGSDAISGMTVLVVDDEQPTRDVLSDILETFGASVFLAEDGPAGLRVFAEHKKKIGVVILDLSMPGMNGVEVATEMRALDPEARIILSSGYPEEDVLKRYPGSRCDGFIQKPYKPAALRSIIAGVAVKRRPD